MDFKVSESNKAEIRGKMKKAGSGFTDFDSLNEAQWLKLAMAWLKPKPKHSYLKKGVGSAHHSFIWTRE